MSAPAGVPRRATALAPMGGNILDATWRSPGGVLGWFQQVNQRRIGARFVVTALVFFLIAGVEALVIRWQLAQPLQTVVGPQAYNQLFTMHGTTMMFLFAIPLVEGFAIYLVPLMIGTRDMAFPRLNAFGYYIFLIGGVTLHVALLIGLAPDVGWFSYVPLALSRWSPGLEVSFYGTMITFIEVSALVAAVELIVTIGKQRAPGMSLNRMPIFVWAVLVMAFMIVFAMPGVIVGSVLLVLDRSLGTVFYIAESGGDPLLWQHLFWWFGHPEVYIIMIPGFGIISHVVTTFTRRPLFGYTAVVLALVATGIVSFGLWVHHMYTTGIPRLASSYFTAASVMIAIPSGLQVFCWIATLWGSRPVLRTPLLFALGAIITFVAGGVTGVMVASVPFDSQVHDTFFVVAHFHYVIFGSVIFPAIAGMYYWFPKWSGRMPSERLGRWSFWVMFIGFHLTFFPMHQLGLEGMPRRIYTYLPGLGWDALNLLATAGAFLLAAGVALFVANLVYSFHRGASAGEDPWGSDTLEWWTTSPPPNYNFRELPVAESREPLWHRAADARQRVITGLREDRREVLITTVLDARPQSVSILPGPTVWPFLAALAASVGFIGVMFSLWAVVVSFLLTFAAIVGWLWPWDPERFPASEAEARR